MRPKINLLFVLVVWITTAQAQEFYEDGSMKLTAISTNKKYGYESTQRTAVKVGKIEHEQAYLKALRGPNGEVVSFRRVGSCCAFKCETSAFGQGLLDKYEVYYQGMNSPVLLYLNGYEYEQPSAPVGFTFVTADKIEKPFVFPSDSIVKVTYCNSLQLHAVGNEFLLKEQVGDKPVPDTNPVFDGGEEAVKTYFSGRPLTDERAKDRVFRVAIAFVVDCNGKAGNFRIITKGKGLSETLANQVLERVNGMPQQWKPAISNGKPVDCYQVLSFTVTSGQLDKVSYRK